jgi:hypothetical protein
MCLTQVAPTGSIRRWKNILGIQASSTRVFATEEGCREYLCQLRWPAGFRCPACGCGKSWPVREVLRQCAGCGHQTSVTAGTILQDTRTPLRLWVPGDVVDDDTEEWRQCSRVAARARTEAIPDRLEWLHKLRSAMVRPGRDLLSGRVEVDESYIGGLEEGLRGRLMEAKGTGCRLSAEASGMQRNRIRPIPRPSS